MIDHEMVERLTRLGDEPIPLFHPTVTEAQWTTWVIETARWHGWMAAHFRPARTGQGWRTALQCHAALTRMTTYTTARIRTWLGLTANPPILGDVRAA